MIRHEKKREETEHEEGARAVQRSLDRRDHGGAEDATTTEPSPRS